METDKNLSNVSWEQVEKIIKDKEFLKNIKELSEEELKQNFKKFDIEPTNDEIHQFRKFFIKVIDNNEDLNDPEYISKKLLDDDELSNTSAGSISSHILAFLAGVAGTCFVLGATAPLFIDKAKEKMDELKDRWNK